VLPDSPIIVIIFMLLYAAGGMALGMLSGWFLSLWTKCGPRGVWTNGLLGSAGYLAGLIGAVYMPWRQNTVTEQLSDGVVVTTTTNTYQHPERIAVLVAILLPLAHELYRFWRARRRRSDH
jgi:hypothetical protein